MALNPFANISGNLLAQEQKKQAAGLKLNDYAGEAMASKELAMQQAYSRRSPGSAYAEEMIRRNTANQISNSLRMNGGDANKSAAIASSANAQANDAVAKLQMQGQSFSEEAFKRLYMANRDIQQGRRELRKDRQALLTSSQQNSYNAIPGSSFFK